MSDVIGALVGLVFVALVVWGSFGSMFSRRYSRDDILRGVDRMGNSGKSDAD